MTMASISINAPGASGFIYNNANLGTARVCITAETEEFDTQTIRAWADEGFDVVYVPFNNGGKDYAARLRTVKDGLGVGDNYAIIGKHTPWRSRLRTDISSSTQPSETRPPSAWTTSSSRPTRAVSPR